MMNDRDLDLILTLAGGGLPPEEASAAEARLAADPDLAADLAAQRMAIAAVQAAAAVELSDGERSRLRAVLREQLQLEEPVSAMAPRRAWGRMVPVVSIAAIAAVVIGAAVVLPGMIGGGDDSGEIEFLAGGFAETTTTVAAAADVYQGESAETTASDSSVAMVPRVERYDLSRLSADDDAGAAEDDGTLVEFDVEQFEACFDELAVSLPGSSGYVVRAVAEEEGRDLLLITYVSGSGETGGASIDPATCELVAIGDDR
jgi:hypothetical protein